MKVNLWDHAFAHVAYSVPGRVSRDIEWVRGRSMWDGVTVITDAMLRSYVPIVGQFRKVVGWLLEGRAYGAANYAAIPRVIDSLDMLLTHDAALLAKYPDKAKFVPFGGCWIPDEKWGMYPKTKLVSMIYSGKDFMEGHRLRHEVAKIPGIDLYGHGCGKPITCKSEGLADYMFSIVIENDRAPNYFTEKLIDCFALGTIPIYWGAPNIGEYFDPLGILDVNGRSEILGALACASVEFKEDHPPTTEAVARNLETARRYVLPEDSIFPIIEGL